jgi:hypothetical protein
MIRHIALYRFCPEALPGQRTAFARELVAASAATGLVSRLGCGEHLTLPADVGVPQSVHSFAAAWDFEDLGSLDAFSRHPAMQRFVAEHAAPIVIGLAIANYEEADLTAQISEAPLKAPDHLAHAQAGAAR